MTNSGSFTRGKNAGQFGRSRGDRWCDQKIIKFKTPQKKITKKKFNRRIFLKTSTLAAGATLTSPLWLSRLRAASTDDKLAAGARHTIAPGPFQPTWESLKQNYKFPEWYRDAKFGIWAHWTAQCVPEQGDWYARNMYIQGNPAYNYHVKTYGHPSKFGFKDIDHLWKAEKWEPEKLMARYKRAGAKYFFALATHHDNFDAYDSKYHDWNAVKFGPKKDIVGTWAKVARANGLRFGISNHSSWAARWLQPAYGYDGEGPLAGVRYDAYTLTKADGIGQWWEGLDPQDLYTGRSVVMPDGLTSAQAVRDWVNKNTSLSKTNPLPVASFCENWFLRCQDSVDKYQPDVLYFDTNELPLEQTGLDVVTHYYNSSAARNGGMADVVVNGKHILPEHVGAFVEDIERSTANAIRPDVWQTDTCIGDWHYSRALAERNGYKTVAEIVGTLLDVVSKNGNLMLNIPLRGDGSIDENEEAFLDGLTNWMDVNSEGIFASRPWKIFGEGPSASAPPPARGARFVPYTPQDIRFTTKGDSLYAYALAIPGDGRVVIKSLAANSPQTGGNAVKNISLLGHDGKLDWSQTAEGLVVKLPEKLPGELTVTFRINGVLAA
jgi:alpha-L-fucosidase